MKVTPRCRNERFASSAARRTLAAVHRRDLRDRPRRSAARGTTVAVRARARTPRRRSRPCRSRRAARRRVPTAALPASSTRCPAPPSSPHASHLERKLAAVRIPPRSAPREHVGSPRSRDVTVLPRRPLVSRETRTTPSFGGGGRPRRAVTGRASGDHRRTWSRRGGSRSRRQSAAPGLQEDLEREIHAAAALEERDGEVEVDLGRGGEHGRRLGVVARALERCRAARARRAPARRWWSRWYRRSTWLPLLPVSFSACVFVETSFSGSPVVRIGDAGIGAPRMNEL